MKPNRTVWIILWGAAIGSLLLELLLPHRHSHFAPSGLHAIDASFGFFAVLGLVGVVLIAIISNRLGRWLKVKEDYYD